MALNDVPLTGQTLDDTRDAIRANFTSYINAQFAVDHQEFNSANAGYHLKVTFQNPAASTIPSVPANGFVIFPAAPNPASDLPGVAEYPVTSAITQINIRRDGSVPIIPMNYAAGISGTNGFTFLPSGIVLMWGQETVAEDANTHILFPVNAAIPTFSVIFQVSINAVLNLGAGQTFLAVSPAVPAVRSNIYLPYVSSYDTLGFHVQSPPTSDGANFDITYLAIGFTN